MLVVGAASRDIDHADPRGWRLGGGVTYGSMALAKLGLPVRALIGADELAGTADELDILRGAGIEVRLVALKRGPVFDNIETPSGRLQRCHSTSDRLPASALPVDWSAPAAALLNPVAGELDWRWARAFPATTLVALGWQGLLRRLESGRQVSAVPLRPLALIDRADIGSVSNEDAAAGGAALARLLRRDGQQLVVTSDRTKSLHLRRESGGFRARSVPLQPVTVVRNPTGAGDVFLASWTAGLVALRAAGGQIAEEQSWRALSLAAHAAGAKVEAAGLADIADLRGLCERLLRPPAVDAPRR